MELTNRSQQLLSKLNEHKLLLIGPVVLGLVLSVVYVMFLRSESWSSRQRLMVRDDLLGQSFKPGQFTSQESMKSRQETILEIARNPEVIRETLKQLGPKSKSWMGGSGNFPDDQTIEAVQGNIGLSAPNGAEFGKTEVVLLSVKDSGSDRSLKFIKLLLDQIEQKISLVRNTQLKSMVSEIQQARDSAKESLQQSIAQLRAMEKELGPDSITMVSLTNPISGENALKTETVQIQSERRVFETQLESLRTSQKTLLESKDDPMLIVSSASSFLREQNKLSQIARSLVDAQKLYADAIGRYEEIHPTVQTAKSQLNAMKDQVSAEIVALSSAVATQIAELEARINRLDNLIDSNNQRLIRLNERRGDHLAINSEITKRMDVLNQHEATLKSIQGLSEASGGEVWFTRIGDPQLSTAPDGLGKQATVLIGGFLGFLLGLGILVLVAFPVELFGPAKEISQASIPHLGTAQTHSQKSNSEKSNSERSNAQRSNTQRSNEIRNPARPSATRVHTIEDDHQSRVAIEDSVTVPDLSISRESKQLEKFVNSIKSKSAPSNQSSNKTVIPPVQKAERPTETISTEAKSGLNQPKKPAAPVDLLTELRNNWAAQTDPLSNINAKAPKVDLTIPVQDESMVSTLPSSQPVFDVTKIQSKISGMQRSNGKSEDIERIKNSLQGTPGNPFLKDSDSKKNQPGKGNLAQQIKAIGDSVIGLVDSKQK